MSDCPLLRTWLMMGASCPVSELTLFNIHNRDWDSKSVEEKEKRHWYVYAEVASESKSLNGPCILFVNKIIFFGDKQTAQFPFIFGKSSEYLKIADRFPYWRTIGFSDSQNVNVSTSFLMYQMTLVITSVAPFIR